MHVLHGQSPFEIGHGAIVRRTNGVRIDPDHYRIVGRADYECTLDHRSGVQGDSVWAPTFRRDRAI
jgi:hypothetical protein